MMSEAASTTASPWRCEVESDLERLGVPLRPEQMCTWAERRRGRPIALTPYRFPPRTFTGLLLAGERNDVIVYDDAARSAARDEAIFDVLALMLDGGPAGRDVLPRVLAPTLGAAGVGARALTRVRGGA